LQVVCATDRQYVEMTGVLIRSVAELHRGDDLEFVVVASELTARHKARLAQCAGDGMKLSFIELSPQHLALLRTLKTSRYLTETAYSLLIIPELVGEDCDRIVCLDCDMVVMRKLDPLFALDMQGKPVAAVPLQTDGAYLARSNEEIGRPPSTAYFNTGALVIDIKAWREARVTERGLAYAQGRTGGILHHDQAALNHVIGADWLPLPREWNQGVAGLSAAECRNAAILHYKGRSKPFHRGYREPALAFYDAHRAGTPWRAARRTGKTERRLMKHTRRLRNAVLRLIR
jgi:lipopolysaccharide biosynthesis glycosyltransferase